MRYLFILLIILYYGNLNAVGQDTVVLSLSDAIKTGTAKSVNAAVVQNEYISSYWEFRNYKTELLPEVVINATAPYYSKSYNQLQNDKGEYRYVSNHYNRVDGGFTVSQNIPWTGGKLSLNTSLQRLQQKGGSPMFYSTPASVILEQPVTGFNRLKWLKAIEPVKYKEASQKLVSDMEEVAHIVIQYYFDLLLGQVNLEMAEQNFRNSEKLFAIAEAKKKLGQMSETEMLQMKVNLLNANSTYIDAQASLDARMFTLRSLLGFDESMIVIPEIPKTSLVDVPNLSYTEVLEKSLENNSFTYNIRRRMLEATRDVSQAKSDRWDVQLYVAFGLSGQENKFRSAFNSNNWRDDQIINVGIRVPIVDWGRSKSKVEIAKANMNVIQSRVDKEERDFNQDIYLRVQNFNYQPEKVLLALEAEEAARKRYETTIEAFILGKVEILNLNDAQQSKDDARRNYINQLYLLWSYYYQIRSLTLYDFLSGEELSTIYGLTFYGLPVVDRIK